ncbi:4-hydroxy-tetrahydrodipicolinate synthase [Hydrobacter penzbergensis]|jgi:4-hydroxy-tetrahydrodipicolinate synthase|uniref:4-hydroxy-tetrahydrodipicolinate synthase n=1 Tax=Hydrobacter penzbergensis TaxID=1235997 RepID=A0A8X8IEB7_9BACT|nr:4-hydroxy-tetrahydrodipicolinate synthase [Hydrobacter penzbergensis]MBN8718356.1 4-hydroxy-tetrahydrodipicolinate synthase [Sediminibacterium magnilacihabitans]PQV62178.1 4-hydroxy-tetrahydrodipicolinate synthase [Sediminibacterium magnilacihabitans]SDW13275.1 4-hydroxy-tetrahydrodipicolinate synthase [Hydrobacter penzbergensis]
MSLRKQLQGTGVALVTPFKTDAQVDFEALGNVIEAMIKGGVEYLVTLGTTGETPTLDKQEKLDIVHYTFEKVAGRVPVVVGIGGNNTQELIKDLHHFPLEKAVAVLSASPYYNKPSQEGLFQHYKAIAGASPKPIILYNVPGRTGRNLNADTTLRLANEVPNIAGIKEASGDMAQCMQLLRDRPEQFLIVSGDDALALPQLACGMDGVISVAANAFPKQFSDMVRACLKADLKTAKKLNDQLMAAYDLMFAENNPAGVKAFMHEEGLLQNVVRLPVVPLSAGLHQKVKAYGKH